MGQTPAQAEEQAFNIGAVGDSISAGFNADRLLNNRELSWSTGTSGDRRVLSHFHRLTDIHGSAHVRAFNEAVMGSESADLPQQTRRLSGRQLDYVTVLIGANDVCTWSGPDLDEKLRRFKTHVTFSVQTLLDGNPGVRVVLVQIPDLFRLWELGMANNCQSKWNLFGICAPLLAEDRTMEERLEFRSRWEIANATLANIADQLNARFPGQVQFDETLGQTEFEAEHLSRLDCFHPSVAGQNLIAEKTWQAGWYE
jgi:lysophospholipase L1-like esterase